MGNQHSVRDGCRRVLTKVSPRLGAMAVMNGDVSFTTSFTSTFRAILQGVPLKLVSVALKTITLTHCKSNLLDWLLPPRDFSQDESHPKYSPEIAQKGLAEGYSVSTQNRIASNCPDDPG